MGTTLTADFLNLSHVVFVNIGDSSAYLYRDGQLEQITRDQTVAQAMIDAGSSPADVRRFSHIMTLSLEGHSNDPDADVFHFELHAGDRLLLCYDGLSDMADDAAIAAVLANTTDALSTCDHLVELALERGGRDNITVIVCELLVGNSGL